MRRLNIVLFLLLSVLATASAQEEATSPGRWQHGVMISLDFGSSYTPEYEYRCGFAGCDVIEIGGQRNLQTGASLGYQLLRVRGPLGLGGIVEVNRPAGYGPSTLATVAGVAEWAPRLGRLQPYLRGQLGTVTPFGLGGGGQQEFTLGWVAQPSVGLFFGGGKKFSFDLGYRHARLTDTAPGLYYYSEVDVRRNLRYNRWIGRFTARF